jgi:tetratricopeptide (TPR) repeat protein
VAEEERTVAKNKNKKKSPAAASQSDSKQAQSLFEQYHEIAQALRSSSDQPQAEVALESVSNEPEAVQMALLKLLAKTNDADAANVLLALNTLSPLKEVRKEARRGLIRLEQSKTYPSWQPPIENTPASHGTLEDESGNPPRFWKGYVTDSREAGEVSMMLLWEQGEDYRDVRGMGFLLEFWSEGVKDFFTYVASKRRAQKEIDTNLQSGQFVSCSLAKAKRLLQEALAVNEKLHSKPYLDYRLHSALVNQLILEAPDIGEEEPGEIDEEGEGKEGEIDLAQLTQTDVIINFVEAWAQEDYELAYDLLASNSPLREGLSREDWAARRETWAEEAQPDWLRPGFVREHESPASGLWLPNALKRRPSNTIELEAGWSIELKDSAFVETLPELMSPVQVFPETGRRWFWITYSIVREDDRWCIHSVADEGARLRTLPSAQLKKRRDDLGKEAEKVVKKSSPEDIDNPVKALTELSSVLSLMQTTLFFEDMLLTKADTREEDIQGAYQTTVMLEDFERGIIYLDILIERFPDERAVALQLRGGTRMQLAEQYSSGNRVGDEKTDEYITHLEEQAEADFRESLSIKDTPQAHMMMGRLLYETGNAARLDEAEAHLHAAEASSVGELEAIVIEHTLGNIATDREQFEQALTHYQRVAEIDLEYEGIWIDIGNTYFNLKKPQDAEASFKKELELHPSELEAYNRLVEIYEQDNRYIEARELLEQGLLANPDSAPLLSLLAAVYYDSGDRESAKELLDEAEEADPEEPLVEIYREGIRQLDLKREQMER